MTIWKRVNPSVADRELLSQTQETAARQQEEAQSLLGATRAIGAILRRSQERNHYGEALESIFGQKKRKEE